jgi:fructokinase
MRVLSIGEILWDVFPDGERLGGAPFNFAAHAARLGHQALMISGVGDDGRGRRALDQAAALGLTTEYIRVMPDQPTGYVTIALDHAGQPSYTIHRPAAYDFPLLGDAEIKAFSSGPADWLYFGTLQQTSEPARALLMRLVREGCACKRFYDVNLRRDCYTGPLVAELMAQADIVKLNEGEMCHVAALCGLPAGSVAEFAREGGLRYGWLGTVVTRGEHGCTLWLEGQVVESAGHRIEVADAVGAGDAFAAAFLHGYASGWNAAGIADFANRVGALVASRRGAIPSWTTAEV